MRPPFSSTSIPKSPLSTVVNPQINIQDLSNGGNHLLIQSSMEKEGEEEKGKERTRAKSLSTNSNFFCHDSASSDLEKGIDFKPPDVLLPLEIISNILSRLPVRSLSRFRCVCKLWCSLLTYDPYFISHHYNESIKRPMLIPTYTRRRTKVPLYELRPSGDIKHGSVHIKIDDPGGFKFSNPVRGLVYSDGYLLNPFTRDVMQLPKSNRRGSYDYTGLGFDDPTRSEQFPQLVRFRSGQPSGFESLMGRCKIVRLISESIMSHYACEVLTMGTHEWRYVGETPCMRPHGHAVFLNEAVHWLAYINYQPLHLGIFAFDIKKEKFQLVSIPITFSHSAYGSFTCVHDLRGHICLVWEHITSHSPQPFLRIWILKDYDKNEWEQKYNIDMSNWVNQYQFEFFGSQIIEVQDGKILIHNYDKIYSFDLQSKNLHELSFFPNTRARIYYGCHVITESLVSPRNMLEQSIDS